jgi:hypothetical protein
MAAASFLGIGRYNQRFLQRAKNRQTIRALPQGF